MSRARHGDALAIAALRATAQYLGAGLAAVVNAVDPARIYIGGEITTAWDMLERIVRAALDERTLEPIRGRADITSSRMNNCRGYAAQPPLSPRLRLPCPS